MREIKFRAWDKVKKVMRNNVPTGTVDIWGGELGFDSDSEAKDCEFMQFTGLRDKNGKEIYEGDIVKVQKEIRKVTWYNFSWNTASLKTKSYYCLSTFEKYEIIGNIYENRRYWLVQYNEF